MKRIIAPRAGLAAVAAATAVLAGAPAALAAPAHPAAVGHAAGLATVKLTLTGSSIKLSGSPVAGAVNVDSVVKSSKGGAPILVHLNPGVTFGQALGAVGKAHGDPNALSGLAQIVFAGGYDVPGSYSAQTVLVPGKWVALDTTKSNPAQWPKVSFTVVRKGAPRALPHADATVKAIDFNFTGPTTWHDGETIRFEDAGYVSHMIVAAKFKDAADAATGMADLKAGNDNATNPLAIGFATFQSTVTPGGIQQEKITASPGVYVLACFMTTQDGREHTTLGMEKMITITG